MGCGKRGEGTRLLGQDGVAQERQVDCFLSKDASPCWGGLMTQSKLSGDSIKASPVTQGQDPETPKDDSVEWQRASLSVSWVSSLPA